MKWTILGWLVALLVGAAFTLAVLVPQPEAAQAFPAQGDWTLTLNATALATCLNRRSFQLPTARIIAPTVYAGTLTISGDALRFRDDVFSRISSTNRFSGTLTLGDGTQAPIQLSIATSSRMTGQIVTGYRVDTTRCSQTITLTFERIE
jgi:hypothetical protein